MNTSSLPLRADGKDVLPPGRLLAVVGVALAVMAAAVLQLEFLNGPQGGKWPWRDLPLARTGLFLAPPVVLFGIAFGLTERRAPAVPASLTLLTGFTLSLQVLAALAGPHSFDQVRRIVESASATSYYTDSTTIGEVGDWLRRYHTLDLGLHSSTHPPGPILYYYFWRWLVGPEFAAAVGGCGVGILAGLGVPLTYAFAGLWTKDSKARLVAASVYAATPALVVFFPEFDQVYPLFTMSLALLWAKAAEGGRRSAIGFGLLLFVATFFAYNLLTLGAYVALDLIDRVCRDCRNRELWLRLGAAAGIGLTAWAAANVALWLAVGYRPIDSFLHALSTEGRYSHGYERPYFFFLAYNVFDFLLGAGMISLPLLLSRLQRIFASPAPWPPEARMTLLAVASVLAVDVSGRLAGETARVWLFLQPFLAVPAGLELAGFRAPARAVVHLFHWMVLVVMTCKLNFVVP